jgi:hypothetical protein
MQKAMTINYLKNMVSAFFKTTLFLIFFIMTIHDGERVLAVSPSDFEQYCRNGVYYTQKGGREISCGRAPNCKGWDYERTELIDFRPNAQCWVEDYYGGSRCRAYCAGNVPLCCYKMAITKNREDCVWTERYYCHPSQCEGVGGGCGQNLDDWCINEDKCVKKLSEIPYIPLEKRLVGISEAANTPTPKAVNTPTPKQESPTPTQSLTRQPTLSPTSFPTPINNTPTYTPNQTNTVLPIAPTEQPTPTFYQALPNIDSRPDFSSNIFDNLANNALPETSTREIVEKTVTTLQTHTAETLALPEIGVKKVLNADKQFEQLANSFLEDIIFRIRVFFIQLGR